MTLIYWNDASLNHITPPGHPERVARVEAIKPALQALDGLEWRDAPKAERAEILRCHPESYLDRIEAASPEHGYSSKRPSSPMAFTISRARSSATRNSSTSRARSKSWPRRVLSDL